MKWKKKSCSKSFVKVGDKSVEVFKKSISFDICQPRKCTLLKYIFDEEEFLKFRCPFQLLEGP